MRTGREGSSVAGVPEQRLEEAAGPEVLIDDLSLLLSIFH
jgi:hypothetical protein